MLGTEPLPCSIVWSLIPTAALTLFPSQWLLSCSSVVAIWLCCLIHSVCMDVRASCSFARWSPARKQGTWRLDGSIWQSTWARVESSNGRRRLPLFVRGPVRNKPRLRVSSLRWLASSSVLPYTLEASMKEVMAFSCWRGATCHTNKALWHD